jgi:hypothetical protein
MYEKITKLILELHVKIKHKTIRTQKRLKIDYFRLYSFKNRLA